MAISRNILLYQGANAVVQTEVFDANNVAVDLTVYTVTGKAKKHWGSANTTTFTCSGYANGLIQCSLDANTMTNLDAGRYVYDIDITQNSTNTTIRIQHGLMTVKPNVN